MLLLRDLTLVASCFVAARVSAQLDSRAPSGNKTVIIQLFEWDWDSIAAECTDFIGPAGYGIVQTSPPQEHVLGPQWWTDYQPVSYILTSKRGNRTQYENMIGACHNVGVKVIADTIFNHMAGMESGTGIAGSKFTHYDYPGIYQYQDFHHCGLEPGDEIVNYDSRLEVQTCQLVNLADLATDTEYVRSRLARYVTDLISLGINGFRLDAAKHIAATDIMNITRRLNGTLYITQEVIAAPGEPIQPSEYVGIGDVQEFRYTRALREAFLFTGISGLRLRHTDPSWVSAALANVFVANHDTERNGESLSTRDSSAYTLAHIYTLAHSYGTPTVLSSYFFTDFDAGSPNNGAGTCNGTVGANGWHCQHRWPEIVGMVGFRNEVGYAPVTEWASPSSQRVAFGRATFGFVAINNEDSVWNTSFSTSLAAGTYCDVVGGHVSSGACTGSSFNVSSTGTFSALVPARSSIAIHIGAQGTASGPSSGGIVVTFTEIAVTFFGQDVFVVGSIPQLGSWSPGSAVALASTSALTWTATLNIPAGTPFTYKYIKKSPDGDIVWESDPDRRNTVPLSGTQTLHDSWR